MEVIPDGATTMKEPGAGSPHLLAHSKMLLEVRGRAPWVRGLSLGSVRGQMYLWRLMGNLPHLQIVATTPLCTIHRTKAWHQ